MNQFTQLIGENIVYEQDVQNDTITAASWTVAPSGPVLTLPNFTPTAATVQFMSASEGTYILEVSLTLMSGQIRIGQARIQVLKENV